MGAQMLLYLVIVWAMRLILASAPWKDTGGHIPARWIVIRVAAFFAAVWCWASLLIEIGDVAHFAFIVAWFAIFGERPYLAEPT